MPGPKDPKKRAEWIEKLRTAQKKNWDDPKYREKQIVAQTGHPVTEEAKTKTSVGLIRFRQEHPDFQKGENHPCFGKHPSEETLQRLRNSSKQYCEEHPGCNAGENNGCFKGGILANGLHYTCNSELRRRVREADHQECQLCGMTREESLKKYGEELSTHHIYGPEDRPLSCNMAKLITLDKKCHARIEGLGFEQYIPMFEEIVRRR